MLSIVEKETKASVLDKIQIEVTFLLLLCDFALKKYEVFPVRASYFLTQSRKEEEREIETVALFGHLEVIFHDIPKLPNIIGHANTILAD